MDNKVTNQRSIISSLFLRSFVVNFHTDLRAKFLDFAIFTIRLAREAAAAAMPDEPMTEQRPIFLRDELHQLLFNLHGVRLFCEAETI